MKFLITKAKRTNAPCQVLGCDSYCDAFKENILKDADILLYVGDGMFHPEALLFSQMYGETKNILCWNPASKQMKIIGKELIRKKCY